MNLVLGGTSGLGLEITRGLQARGEEIFVVGSSYDEAKDGAGMRVDLAEEVDVYKLAAHIRGLGETTLKRFWWVAGKGYNGDFAGQPNAHELAMVNFANAVPVAQAAWEQLIQPEPTNFVVVSSTTGEKARADEAVYAGTKHAQVGMARSLGLESERLGLQMRVALFMPGGMKTPFWDEHEPKAYETFLDPAKVAERIIIRVFEQQTPFYEETIPKGSL